MLPKLLHWRIKVRSTAFVHNLPWVPPLSPGRSHFFDISRLAQKVREKFQTGGHLPQNTRYLAGRWTRPLSLPRALVPPISSSDPIG